MSTQTAVSIVRGKTPLTEKDINALVAEALDLIGGIGAFVKKGDTVAIKPNLFAPYPPPISVDRRVIGALTALCRKAGADRVVVIEGVSVGSLIKRVNIDRKRKQGKLNRGMTTREVMRLLGVTRSVEAAGGEVMGVEETITERVPVPGGKVLHYIDYPEIIKNADVFIDLPALKTHTMTMVTLGVKNLQGILTEADRYLGHRDDLDQHLVDILKIRKPDLTLVDGLIGMEGMGAGEGGSPVEMGLILAGEDVVAVDAVSSKVMGIQNPGVVGTTRIAAYDGIGTMDLGAIEIKGRPIGEVSRSFLLPYNFTQPIESFVTGVYPNVDVFIGGACPSCWLMSAMVLRSLAQIPEGATLIVGVDPKIPEVRKWDFKNTFLLGDCAIGSSGPVRDIRNRITLEGHDTFLYGCLPYQQAMIKLEDILLERGVITTEELIQKAEMNRTRFFDYYRGIDPTWEPEL